MSDKRSVATDALETLGTIIDDKQKRDAIHLAVEPVVAGEALRPGNHIRVSKGVAHRAATGEGMGIVDPFLQKNVRPGEWFWFVMYPRMVHSLRHVWTHPDFPDEVETEAYVPDKAESEKWLRNFCNSAECPDYDKVMELIGKGTLPSEHYDEVGGRYDEDYLHFTGFAAHGEIPSEFWVHAEIVLGRKLPYHPQYFSCSC